MDIIKILVIGFIIQNLSKDSMEAIREIKVKPTPIPPIIDGKLSDKCWKIVKGDSEFIQIYPTLKEKAIKTIVKATYDSNYLYFAFYCPKLHTKPSTALMVIDTFGLDDQVFIIIDPFNDKRKGYLFGVTPLNKQIDAKIAKDGCIIYSQWDEIWFSQTSINDTSWIAEFAIPFEILFFKEKEIWKINFIRSDYQDIPELKWSVWNYTGSNPFRVSKCGKLMFEKKINSPASLHLIPYATLTQKERKLSIDIERTFPTIMNMSFSWNTEPCYYDIKNTQLFINPTKEELYKIPEQRRFFTYDYPLFVSPYSLFFTRMIDNIKYGLRIGGKAGEYDASYMRIESKEILGKNYSFLGIERGFWSGSTISWYDLKCDTNRIMSVQADFSLNYEIRPKIQYSWNPIEKYPYLISCKITRETTFLSIKGGGFKKDEKFIPLMSEEKIQSQYYWIKGEINWRPKKWIYKISPYFSYTYSDTNSYIYSITSGGQKILFKNGITIGGSYNIYDKSSMFFIEYNEYRWAPWMKVIYKDKKIHLFGRMSFLKKISPEFVIYGVKPDSFEINIIAWITPIIGIRMTTQYKNDKSFVKLLLSHKFRRGVFSLAYKKEDRILEVKIFYIWTIPGEKLKTLTF